MVDNNTGGGGASDDGIFFKEQDRWLPIANVGRIMKQRLPPNAKISKEAKETMQECVSEFISFVTSEASEKCKKERRKTVNGDDVCWAMGTLGFDDYEGPLRRYLQRYREAEGDRAIIQQDQKPTSNINGNNNNNNTSEDQEKEDKPSAPFRYNNQQPPTAPAPGRSGSSSRGRVIYN